MCARVTLISWDEMKDVARSVQARLSREAFGDFDPAWSGPVRPGAVLPAFVDAREGDSATLSPALAAQPFTWGYELPSNSKLVYNSRIEKAESPFWKASFNERRAVVPIAQFFEPHKSETQRNPKTGRMGKRTWAFRQAGGGPLLLGAVYQGGRISIVTTEPCASVAPVHHRMPLVLAFEEVPTWMGPAWRSLADRSSIALDAAPEWPAEPQVEQLSLF